MRDIIVDLQSSDTWEIQLTVAIDSISAKDIEEKRIMHSNSNNIRFTPDNDANKVINELFEWLCSRYQENLETSVIGSDFIFDSVRLIYCKCHKVNFICGGSYIDSPDLIKNKKATVNPKNEDDKCFQYSGTAASNYEEIKCNPTRVSDIKHL